MFGVELLSVSERELDHFEVGDDKVIFFDDFYDFSYICIAVGFDHGECS